MTAEFSVKVNKVPQGTTPDELRIVFQAAGFTSITDVYLPEKFAKFEFGFVRFADLDEAQQAADMQDLMIRGANLACELAVNDKKRAGPVSFAGKGPPVGTGGSACSKGGSAVPQRVPKLPDMGGKSAGEHSIWVGSLPAGTTPDQLQGAIAACGVGTMTDVYIPPGRDYGFLRFATCGEAEHAMRRCVGLELGGCSLEFKPSTTGKRSVGQQQLLPPARPVLHDRYGELSRLGPCGKGPDWHGPRAGFGPGVERHRLPIGKGPDWHAAPIGKGKDWYGPALPMKGHLPPRGNFGCWVGAHAFDGEGPGGCGGHSRAGSRGPAPAGGSGEYSIWVGTLPAGVSPEELREAFGERGVETMTDVYVPPGRDFGFIRFATYREADEAVRRCKDMELRGTAVELKLSTSEKRSVGQPPAAPPQQPPAFVDRYSREGPGCGSIPSIPSIPKGSDLEVSVKVGNLGQSTSIDDLREAFLARGIGTMTDIYIPRGKSFGFVRFHKLSEAQVAVECSGMQVCGNRITCEMAEGDKRSSEHFPGHPPCDGGFGLSRQGGCALKGGCGVKGWGAEKGGFSDDASAFRNEVSVKVGNLPPDVSPDEVCESFAAQGIDSMTDCYIPLGRRFGFLRFTTAAEGRYALNRQIWIQGHLLELEPALGNKRTPDEMQVSEQSRQKRPALAKDLGEAPHDPNISPDAPSVKVSGMPPGTTSQELHQALLDAGWAGKVTDVYVPKGNRGFGFFRFATLREAEDASQLQVWVRGARLGLDVAVQERKVHARLEEEELLRRH